MATLVHSQTDGYGSASNISPSVPPTPGNLMVLSCQIRGIGLGPNPGAFPGWTSITPTVYRTGDAGGNFTEVVIFWRRVQPGDSLWPSAGTSWVGTYMEWEGVADPIGGEWVESGQYADHPKSGGPITVIGPRLLIGANTLTGINDTAASVVSPTSPNVEVDDSNGVSGNPYRWTAYQVALAAGTYSVNGTFTSSPGIGQCRGITAAFSLGPVCPEAAFSASPRFIAAGGTVTFTDESTNSPTSWLWDFGDGTTSTLQNPTHVYADIGLYDVSLTVFGDGDCEDTATIADYVHVGTVLGLDVFTINPPGDSYSAVGTLNESTDKTIRPVLNDVGSGAYTINRNSVEATAAAIRPGNFVKVRIPEIDDDYIFAFFMDQGDFTLLHTDEEGGENFTFGGEGLLSYLNRAVWRNYRFTVDWWPGDVDPPPTSPDARGSLPEGLLRVPAGKHRIYNVDPDPTHDQSIPYASAYTYGTMAAFDAYFADIRTYRWYGATGAISTHIVLVRFLTTEPHGDEFMSPYDETNPIEMILPNWSEPGEPIKLTDVAATPGGVLYRMIQEAQSPERPADPIPLVTIDFDATTDSNGDLWTATDALTGLTADPSEDYITTLKTLIGTGVIDVWMGPNFDLHAVNAPSGRDLTSGTFAPGKVRFAKAVNIAEELRREMLDRKVATHAEVQSNINGGFQRAATEIADAEDFVTRELGVFADSTEIEHEMIAVGDAALAATQLQSDAITFEHITGDDDAGGVYLPGPEGTDHGKYWLGDTVRVHTGTGEQDFNEVDLRVAAVTITEDDAANLRALPELASQVGQAERDLFSKDGTSSGRSYSPGAAAGGGGSATPSPTDVVGTLALDDLTDVDTTSTPPDDQQALLWDAGSSLWVPGDVATGGGGGGGISVSEVTLSGSTVSVTSGADATILSLLLPAGEYVIQATTTITTVTPGADYYVWLDDGSTVLASGQTTIPTNLWSAEISVLTGKITLTVPTTVYLKARSSGATGTAQISTPNGTKGKATKIVAMNTSSGSGSGSLGSALLYRGYNTIGASVFVWPASYYGLATKITTGSVDELLLGIEGYVDQTANNVGDYVASVWADDGGTVGRLIAAGGSQHQTYLGGTAGGVGAYPARWFGPGLPVVRLAANTDYWIGLTIDAGANGPRIYYDTGGSDRSINQAGVYITDGERWAQTNTTKKLSIRGLVLPVSAGGGASVTPVGQSIVPVLRNSSWFGYVTSATSTYPGSPHTVDTWVPWSDHYILGSGWLANATLPATLQIQLPAAKRVATYGIVPWVVDTGDSRWPKTWTFEGSNDGSSWTTLDTRTNFLVASWAAAYNIPKMTLFTVSSPGTYSYYRWVFTANNGNAYTGMVKLGLFE